MSNRRLKAGDWYIDAKTKEPIKVGTDGVYDVLDGKDTVRRLKPDSTQASSEAQPGGNDPQTVSQKDMDAAEEVSTEGLGAAKKLYELGLLIAKDPDGIDDGEMVRGCSVERGDIAMGHDGNYYVVINKNVGNGKWDVKSKSKILRWKPEIIKEINNLGFSLNPGKWGKAGITAESLIISLGIIRNDINE